MSFLGKLTGGGVDWSVELGEGAVRGLVPGTVVRGTARLTARRDIDARGIVAALIGVGEWKVNSSRRDIDGRVVRDTTWRTDDLGRIEQQLAGPTRLTDGQALEFPFELALPPSAAPSFDSNVLRVKWELEVKLDVGGVDPSANQPVRVLLPASALRANAAALGTGALATRVDEAGAGFAIEIDPLPLVAGAPFRGAVETGDGLRDARVEIKLGVDVRDTGWNLFGTLGRDALNLSRESGDSEVRTIWTGALRESGAAANGRTRYEFGGELPAEASPTVVLPYGQSTAKVDVVLSRRFMPDRHLTRDVAIATSEA